MTWSVDRLQSRVARFREQSRHGRVVRPLLAVLVVIASSHILSGAARAELVSISATSLVLRCPCSAAPTVANELGDEQDGLLLNATGSYFATPPLRNGVKVCRFSLLFRDSDADFNISARLQRKVIGQGGDAFTQPVLMAELVSTGAEDPVRKKTTTSIINPKINLNNSFYYVEVEIPGTNLEVLGVQIETEDQQC